MEQMNSFIRQIHEFIEIIIIDEFTYLPKLCEFIDYQIHRIDEFMIEGNI